ncbi:MAG: hypothetical protein JSV03_13570 [Planctomycetota bacterium]|nr:MAG: hypothetical protein JSV03_13570 [Planctomycetota bacterium]
MTRFIKVINGFGGLLILFSGVQLAFAKADVTGFASTQPARGDELDISRLLIEQPAQVESHRNQLDYLQWALDAADKPTASITAHLAMANWLLAVPTSGPARRWLIGVEKSTDQGVIGVLAEEALTHISEARSLFDAEADLSKERQQALADTIENLDLFAKLFMALGSPGEGYEYRSACSRAALDLSVIREADDKALASCALLWQSFALELGGRRERALISLPEALKRPEQWPYDFMCRLLRCRILADAGRYAAATAMTIRMQGLCRKWLESKNEDAESCRRLVSLLQYRIGRLWMKQLNPSDAAHMEDLLVRLLNELLEGDGQKSIYRLEYTVPIIVQPPDLIAPSLSTAPAATTRTTLRPATLPISTTTSTPDN